MKTLLCSIAFTLALASPANALECTMRNVVLVDQEEASIMGKTLGEPYQCAQVRQEGITLFDMDKEENAVTIGCFDPRYKVIPADLFYVRR